MELDRLIRVARGEEPADVVLAGGRLVNVYSGEVYDTGIAIAGDRIAGLGHGYEGRQTVDLGGRHVCPGFIDAHVHIESAMVRPREFARAVIRHGVTTVITDPHEIANVAGVDGIRFMLRDSEDLPMTVFVNAPSCVPASDLQTSGARLDAEALRPLLAEPRVLGLAEVMTFQGVLDGAGPVLAKLEAFQGRVIDGHAPQLTGKNLNAYVAAGIATDHECVNAEEALEKLRLGTAILIREASNAGNLAQVIRVVRAENERRLCFCTDDRSALDLVREGSIDHLVRRAISEGVEPVAAIRMATLNAAEIYGLSDRGAVAPGRRADLVVFQNLAEPRTEQVWVGGECVFPGGEASDGDASEDLTNLTATVRGEPWRAELRVPAGGDRIRVIGVVPDALNTESLVLSAKVDNGEVTADPARDVAKMAVIERHRGSGGVGLGFVKGMGLTRGAIAGTVAHDHHNLVAIGVDDHSMRTAVRAVCDAGGGLAAAEEDRVLAALALPIGGLMSDRPLAAVARDQADLLAAAHDLGSPLHDPFMQMSFLTLEVIPSLKLTDAGLIDVERCEVVEVFANQAAPEEGPRSGAAGGLD